MCGEHAAPAMGQARTRGSPPRVRGTHFLKSIITDSTRITPACAGNTHHLFQILLVLWDHPRVCGEHDNPFFKSKYAPGSPPRVRGTPLLFIGQVQDYRITPACAGNTGFSKIDMMMNQDHPRVCGEHHSPFDQ